MFLRPISAQMWFLRNRKITRWDFGSCFVAIFFRLCRLASIRYSWPSKEISFCSWVRRSIPGYLVSHANPWLSLPSSLIITEEVRRFGLLPDQYTQQSSLGLSRLIPSILSIWSAPASWILSPQPRLGWRQVYRSAICLFYFDPKLQGIDSTKAGHWNAFRLHGHFKKMGTYEEYFSNITICFSGGWLNLFLSCLRRCIDQLIYFLVSTACFGHL